MAARNTKKDETETTPEVPETFSDGSIVQEEDDSFGGFFDGVDDIEDVDNDPFFMPDGVYLWQIVDAERKRSKTGKMGMNIKLKVVDGPFKGNTQWGPWRRVPLLSDPEFREAKESGNDDVIAEAMFKFKKMQAQLRSDFEAFGIAADELKGLKDKDLIGRYVKGRTRNVTDENDEKQRKIVAYYIADEVSGEDGQGGFGQFSTDFQEPDF